MQIQSLKPVLVALSSSIFIAGAALASDVPVTILGITMGTPVAKLPSVCSLKSIADENDPNTCWIGKPYKAKDGSLLGAIQFPGALTRPRWARFSTFQAYFDRQKVIASVKATVSSTEYREEIIAAIKQRFGNQTEPDVTTQSLFAATWRKSDIYIHLLCSRGEFCSVEFMLPSRRAEIDAEIEARKKRDAQHSGI